MTIKEFFSRASDWLSDDVKDAGKAPAGTAPAAKTGVSEKESAGRSPSIGFGVGAGFRETDTARAEGKTHGQTNALPSGDDGHGFTRRSDAVGGGAKTSGTQENRAKGFFSAEGNGEAAAKSRKNKTVLFVLGLGLVGILLISLTDCDGGATTPTASAAVDTEDYAAELEEEVRALVAGITGDEAPTVVVTLAQGVEYIYEFETKKSGEQDADGGSSYSDERNVIRTEDENGREQALVRTALEPKVAGVVVVCSGGDTVMVRSRVIQAVSTALSVSTDKVYVTAKGIP